MRAFDDVEDDNEDVEDEGNKLGKREERFGNLIVISSLLLASTLLSLCS